MFEQLALLSLGEGGWGMALLAGALVTLSLALACVPPGLALTLNCRPVRTNRTATDARRVSPL